MMNDTFMKEKPVLPLILSMSLPMVLSMLVNSLYNGRGGSQKSGSGSHAGTCACRDSWHCYDSLLYYDHAGFPADVHFIRSGH